MSLFKLPVKIRNMIDQLRKIFLWYGGHNAKKKYALIVWSIVCKDRKNGGLGVMNLEIMNNALLAKLMVRYKDVSFHICWKNILRFKYHNVYNKMKYFTFWKDVQNISEVVEFCLNKMLGNGKSTLFWLDRWLVDTSYVIFSISLYLMM
jgi:hypothetical protein